MNYLLSAARRIAMAVLLLLVPVLGTLLAVPAMADEQVYEPIYPMAPSGAPSDGQGKNKGKNTIRVPDLVAEEGNFHLAVIDSVQAQIDNQEVLDAVRETMGQTNAKIVVGVDTAGSAMEGGAARFIRAMTLFGPTSYLLLHDDWPESTDTKGYLQDGWIVIGLVLPDADGKGAEIAIDKAWNVTGDRSAALSRSVAALRQHMDRDDYTQAVIEAVRTTTDELKAPRDFSGQLQDYRGPLLVGLGVLAVLATVLVLAHRRRTRQRAEDARRVDRTGELFARLPAQLRELESCTPPESSLQAGGIIQQRAELLGRAIAPLASFTRDALAQGPETAAPSAAALERLEEASGCQQELVAACSALNGLLSGGSRGHQRWAAIIAAHRDLLEGCATLLDRKELASLDSAARLRAHLITDTDALDEAQQWLNRPKSRSIEPVAMLERLWALRLGLQADLEQLLEQVKGTKIKLPQQVTKHLAGREQGKAGPLDDLATIDGAAQRLERWLEAPLEDRA